MTTPALPPEILTAARMAGREAALALLPDRTGASAAVDQRYVTAYADAAVEAALAAAFDGCEVEVQRSLQGEDKDGPWIQYVPDEWPRLQHGGKRFTRLAISTPWVAARTIESDQTTTQDGEQR